MQLEQREMESEAVSPKLDSNTVIYLRQLCQAEAKDLRLKAWAAKSSYSFKKEAKHLTKLAEKAEFANEQLGELLK